MSEEVFVVSEVRPYDTALVVGVFRTLAGAEAYCASRGVLSPSSGTYTLKDTRLNFLEIEAVEVQP